MVSRNNKAEVDGAYVAAFTQQAGEVSPVFEQKVQQVFESELGGVEGDEWYPVEDVIEAFEQILEQAGEKTMERGGVSAGESLPWPDGVDTVAEGLATLDQMHQAAYRGGGEGPPAGEFTVEVESRTARVGITEGYPYPDAYARGALSGAVQSLAGSRVDISETDARGAERTAWTVEW